MKRISKPSQKDAARGATGSDRIAAAVLEAIECISTVPRELLAVTVDRGWVRLEGVLPDWSQKEIVDDIVRHVPGVKGLISLIRVEPEYHHKEQKEISV